MVVTVQGQFCFLSICYQRKLEHVPQKPNSHKHERGATRFLRNLWSELAGLLTLAKREKVGTKAWNRRARRTFLSLYQQGNMRARYRRHLRLMLNLRVSGS